MLSVGSPAPLFTTTDQNGCVVSLGDFKGRKVILYFYPKDNTPACTAQACNLRDNYNALLEQGYIVLGISPDSALSHTKFIAKQQLPFSLLVDTDTQIAQQYGVWRLKKFMGREYMGIVRTTFVIDETGNISEIIDKVETKNHAAQIGLGVL